MPVKVHRKVNVIGHRNPDTDSVCAAIALAHLKNQQSKGKIKYEARIAGALNRETEFALKYFKTRTPRLCTSLQPQVKDIDIRKLAPVPGEMSLREAWSIMKEQEIDTLVIAGPARELQGVITVKDIATANMESFDYGVLASSHTSYRNLLETLNATMVVGDADSIIECGRLCIGAGSAETLEQHVKPGDIVLMGNRFEAQFCAIEMGAGCVIVCTGSDISPTIRRLAEEKGVKLVSTAYDTYTAGRLISQAAPVRYYMTTENLKTFSLNTPVEDAQKVMASVRFRYFPVLDDEGRYCGVISRRNLLNLHRKQVILVDHNEKTQTVEGVEDAEILEIVDHHRLGGLETVGPVAFRNVPVGCTCTIIYQMYAECREEIPRNIAGLMLSAILSDTLMFRSPTSTEQDEAVGHALAQLAGVDIEKYADEMFVAGGDLRGKTAAEVFNGDFKVFNCGDCRFGVGQGSYMTEPGRRAAQELIGPYMVQAMQKQNLHMVFYMFTDVRSSTTELMMAGEDARALVENAFHPQFENELAILPGVVSRKKQLIPSLMVAMQQ